MFARWYGTASLGVEHDGKSILIDPFFNKNTSLPCAQMEEFTAYDSIFLTHGHYDHLADVPSIVRLSHARVYCTATPAHTLIKMGVDESLITVIAPDTVVSVNGFNINVYHAKHVNFDIGTIARRAVSFDFYRHLPTALRLISTSVTMPEAGEIVGYHIHAGNDDMFVLGSLNYDENVKYPEHVGTLVVPYNGCSNLEQAALSVTEKFNPDRVLLDHYDDSFPPITQYVDTSGFLKLMKEVHPQTSVECMCFCADKYIERRAAAAVSFA